MGTNIVGYEEAEEDNLNFLLKRFWGGSDRGVMYQVTEINAPFRYVQLSEYEMMTLCSVYLKAYVKSLQEYE